jgi:hypothetical protein
MEQASNAPVLANPVQPRNRRGRGPLLIAMIGTLAALALIAFVISGPYRTLKGLQAAIAFDDSAALSRYVEFPTLRANLKQQINARTQARLNAALPTGALSRLANGIANSVADAAVDTLVTPTGLNKLVLGASVVAGQLQGEPSGTLAQRFESGHGSFEAPDRFTYAIGPTPTRELTLILTRSGLSWQLTNVVLPVEP